MAGHLNNSNRDIHLNSSFRKKFETVQEEKEYLEAIDQMFWDECSKLGKWKPSENSSHENPFYSWLGDKYFRLRNRCFSPFNKYPFRCMRLTVGEILIHLFLIISTLGGNLYSGYWTTQDPSLTTTGKMSMASMILVFAFSGKISIWSLVFGLSFENQLQFHKFAALNVWISLIVHVAVKGYLGPQGTSGFVFIGVLVLLFGFSISCMRR